MYTLDRESTHNGYASVRVVHSPRITVTDGKGERRRVHTFTKTFLKNLLVRSRETRR